MRHGIAFLLLALALALTACGGGGTPANTGGGGTSSGNANNGKALFASKQCITCHTLKSVPGATGTIGPDMDGIGTRAATRVSGKSAADYIRDSIKDPNAFIVPGYTSPSPMILPVPVSDSEINDLVAFLVNEK
jgi:cytochrome c2